MGHGGGGGVRCDRLEEPTDGEGPDDLLMTTSDPSMMVVHARGTASNWSMPVPHTPPLRPPDFPKAIDPRASTVRGIRHPAAVR